MGTPSLPPLRRYYHSLVFLLWVGCRRVDRAGLRLAEWLGNGASAQVRA